MMGYRHGVLCNGSLCTAGVNYHRGAVTWKSSKSGFFELQFYGQVSLPCAVLHHLKPVVLLCGILPQLRVLRAKLRHLILGHLF